MTLTTVDWPSSHTRRQLVKVESITVWVLIWVRSTAPMHHLVTRALLVAMIHRKCATEAWGKESPVLMLLLACLTSWVSEDLAVSMDFMNIKLGWQGLLFLSRPVYGMMIYGVKFWAFEKAFVCICISHLLLMINDRIVFVSTRPTSFHIEVISSWKSSNVPGCFH